jgi:hypothetical protein
MAFIVEDGTGRTDSNAYVSIAEIDDFFLLRDPGAQQWNPSLAVSVKQAAIVLATDYIDSYWREEFQGSIINRNQALQWPRSRCRNLQWRIWMAPDWP